MELLDVFRILRRRWLPGLLVAVVVAGLFALLPTRMMPLPPSTAVTEVTLRLQVVGTDAATIAKHRAALDDAATSDSTLVWARNLANVGPDYMKTGAKLTWRDDTTFDVTFTGPDRDPTLELARDYAGLVSDLDGKIISGATVQTVSTRDVIANQRVLPQDESLGRKALSVPLGIVAGVILGLATAFAVNALDKRVRGRQDLPLTGLLDSQVLGEGSAAALAQRIARLADGPVAVSGVGDVADLEEALRDAGVATAEAGPTVVVARVGALKADVRTAVESTRDLAAVGVLR